MGGRSSKLVITPENVEAAANSVAEVITQLKSNEENGNAEAIPPIDEVTVNNGDCQTPADITAETIPANGSIGEIKHKKANPINWIQKKISFKKAKTAKKPECIEVKPAEPVVEELQTVNTEENTKTEDIHVQSEEVPKVDQGTAIPENEVESAAQPVVEITPSAEEVQNCVGEEQFVEEEEPKEAPEEVEVNGNGIVHEEEPEEQVSHDVDMGISEKMANLGIDAAESFTNGAGIHPNGDAIIPDDES